MDTAWSLGCGIIFFFYLLHLTLPPFYTLANQETITHRLTSHKPLVSVHLWSTISFSLHGVFMKLLKFALKWNCSSNNYCDCPSPCYSSCFSLIICRSIEYFCSSRDGRSCEQSNPTGESSRNLCSCSRDELPRRS